MVREDKGEVGDMCLDGQAKPRPRASLFRTDKFGDMVTVNLKEYDRQD